MSSGDVQLPACTALLIGLHPPAAAAAGASMSMRAQLQVPRTASSAAVALYAQGICILERVAAEISSRRNVRATRGWGLAWVKLLVLVMPTAADGQGCAIGLTLLRAEQHTNIIQGAARFASMKCTLGALASCNELTSMRAVAVF